MPQVDDVIAGYISLRDQKEATVKKHKEELGPINLKMDKVAAWLQKQLVEQGLQNFKGKSGVAFLQTDTSVKVEDFDALLSWIKDNNAWFFLEKRAAKTVVQEYVEAHGEVPPGLNISSEVVVHVRKS
jgi:hypothetical protein